MSQESGKHIEINRRSLLKQAAIAGVGSTASLSTLLGTVHAEEVTATDRERLKNAPGVQTILSELGIGSLPGPETIEKRRIEDDGEMTDGELELWKVDMRYGMLTVIGYDSRLRAVFNFDVDLSSAPDGYSVVTKTGGSLGATGTGLEFTRRATDAETELLFSKIDVNGEIDGGRAHATTEVNGFIVNVTVRDPDTDEIRSEQHIVTVGETFDPRTQLLPNRGSMPRQMTMSGVNSPEPTVNIDSRQVQPQLRGPATNLIKDVLEDWILGKLADEPLEALGTECDDTCSSCVTYIVDILTTCRWCVSLCSTSASGVTAILCVVCFYAFCNDSIKQINCAGCFACLITGEEPDLPGSSTGAALDWVWDEIPKPPSLPSIGDIWG